MAVPPEEIGEEILSRLPVKSLLRFRSASKNLYSLITKDNGFAKLHLNQSSSASQTLDFFQTRTGIIKFKNFQLSSEIPLPHVIPDPQVVGSANGLICVASYDDKFCFIWNPSTGHSKRLLLPADGYYMIGFGYDSVSDDYKIVGEWDSKFRVFSLKSNSWRLAEKKFSHQILASSVFLNGALHWQISPITIAAFDLAKEKFFFINLPEDINFGPCMVNGPVFVHQGCLCVFDCKAPAMTVWLMKEYNVTSSWVKFSTVLAPTGLGLPVCLTDRAGEVVYWQEAATLLRCNAHGKVGGELHIPEDSFAFQSAESLIWPKYLDVDKVVPIGARMEQRKKSDYASMILLCGLIAVLFVFNLFFHC